MRIPSANELGGTGPLSPIGAASKTVADSTHRANGETDPVRLVSGDMADHYSTLGVARFSDPMTIRTAYRTLARRSHPDAGGDDRTMARLNDAWTVLSQPERRASYDEELRTWEQATAQCKPTPRRTHDGHTILDFGRYAGWSLVNIGAVDDDYLVWLSRTPTGRTLRAEISQILEERARALEATRPVVASTKRRGWFR